MRLIDADKLKDEVNSKRVLGRFNTIQLIDNAPTVERPQGEWEKPFLHSDGRWYHKCTNCHISSEVSVLQDKYCNFCVNCGADMRKGGAE